jgi:putative ABC transport system permease protein
MNILESIRIAFTSLRANKLRALLTMLGIIIGVGAVVGMLSIGNGLGKWIENEFNRLGVGVFYISPQVDTEDVNSTQRPQLTNDDIQALLVPGAAPAIETATVEYNGNGVVSAGGDRYFYTVKGVTPSYFSISSQTLGAGRFHGDAEERSRARVAVIGNKVAETLIGGSLQDAIGRQITINGVRFDVIGVLTTSAGIGGQGRDPAEEVYLPYETAVARLFRNQVDTRVNVSTATVQARSREEVDLAIRQATEILRERHRLTYQPNSFQITNPEEAARQAQSTIVGFNAFLGTIGGISLLVGGIGIMNIMLVSVTQRTREIGLRKAVGAKRRDIMMQFLIESITLTLLGGGLGVALGWLLSIAGNFVLINVFRAEGARATVTLDTILLATIVSTVIGVVFGLFPAVRAAGLNPIRALRAE